MGSAKLLPGILMSRNSSIGISRNIEFVFNLTMGNPSNPNFFTSPALIKLLRDNKRIVQNAIDHGLIIFNYAGVDKSAKKEIYSEVMEPFGSKEQRYYKKVAGNGIGSNLKRMAIEEMLHIVGHDFLIIPWKGVSPHYAKLLGKLGVSVNDDKFTISARLMLRKLRKYHRTHEHPFARLHKPVRKVRANFTQKKRIKFN